MKSYVSAAIAVAFLLTLSGSAEAGALSLLTMNNIRDFLEDDDYESLVNVDGSTTPALDANGDPILDANGDPVLLPTVTEDDIFVGIFRVNFINGTNTGVYGSTFAGVLVAAVDDVTGSTVTFRAVTVTEYDDLRDGSLAGLGSVALANLPAVRDDDTALFVYDDSNPPNFINPDGAGSGFTGVNDAISTATNGTFVFEFGFTGDAEAYATLGGGSIGVLSFQLALNETANSTGIILNDVSQIAGLNPTQIQVNGEVDSIDPLDTGDFQLRTDANIYINPVPEPGSLTLLGLGALGLLGGARLRRRNAA